MVYGGLLAYIQSMLCPLPLLGEARSIHMIRDDFIMQTLSRVSDLSIQG